MHGTTVSGRDDVRSCLLESPHDTTPGSSRGGATIAVWKGGNSTSGGSTSLAADNKSGKAVSSTCSSFTYNELQERGYEQSKGHLTSLLRWPTAPTGTGKSLRIHNVELVPDLTLLPNTTRKPQLFPNSTGSRLVVNGPKESSGNKNTKYHPLLLQWKC